MRREDKTFTVVPEAKMVIGKGDFYIDQAIKDISSVKKNSAKLIYEWLWDHLDATHVKVKAKCDNLDKFDEATGVDICSSKLDMKAHLRMARYYDRLHRFLIETANEALKLCVKHQTKAMAIQDDLDRTYGGDVGGKE